MGTTPRGLRPKPRKRSIRDRDALRSRRQGRLLLQGAVHRHKPLSLEGLRERAFTFAFRGLVYPQIWEDPVVDLAALEITPGMRLMTIASGGCNVLSYLVADLGEIIAVDLNAAHVALVRLKVSAAQHLPDYESFMTFFGRANSSANVHSYDQHLKHRLDPEARAYWQARDLKGRRRISRFARNFYRSGLLGRFIGAGHLIARLHGANPRALLEARTRAEQRAAFEATLAPLFQRRSIRWLVNRPASLYGLGIPPAQYRALVGDREMSDVLRGRLERLMCDFDLKDNYFAWQALARGYAPGGDGPLPPYLERRNYAMIRDRANRVRVEQVSITERLRQLADSSLDRYVLLDAQDWMGDDDLTALWRQVTRTARPGARVIFRTAGEATILPGRVPDAILSHWHYEAERSAALGRQDRSAIYGGFHLYRHVDQ